MARVGKTTTNASRQPRSTTPPGPIAPYAWVRAIIAYARATMPADRTILALPAYGYDWSPHHPGVAIAAREAPALAAGQGVAPDWDRAQQEDTFSYGPRAHRHTVWYEPTASSVERARLAATAGLAGVAIWAAGDEDPGLWAALSPLERSAIPDDRRRVRWGAWPGR